MAGRLVRALVLLCAVVAVTRAQVWYSHGNPPGTKIKTAMAPWTNIQRERWFGVATNGELWERIRNNNGNWVWTGMGRPPSNHAFDSEPCMFEGIGKKHLTTSTGYLWEHHWWPPWPQTGGAWTYGYHGRPNPNVAVAGCSTVYGSNLKARTFVQGWDGTLWERYWEWATSPGAWTWRYHGKPFNINLRYGVKTSSYVASSTGGTSHVYVVSVYGRVYRRRTHQDNQFGDPGETWTYYGKPWGTFAWRVHATLAGGVWVVSTNGRVCIKRGSWFPCYGLTNRKIKDCSDPFAVSGGTSVFCITQHGLHAAGASGYGLYQLTLPNSPPNTSPIPTWTNHGVPTMPFYYYFLDRPNVAFSGNNVKSVFVTSTNGVFELRF